MASGQIDLRSRRLGRHLQRTDTGMSISSLDSGQDDVTSRMLLVSINRSRLPATISSDPEKERRLAGKRSSQLPTVGNRRENRPLNQRISSRTLLMHQAVDNYLSGGQTHKTNRLIKQPSSFRFNAIKELANKNEPIRDVYSNSLYPRRLSNFSDTVVDVAKSQSLPRPSLPNMTKQMSLLSLGSKTRSCGQLYSGHGSRKSSLRKWNSRKNMFGHSPPKFSSGRHHKLQSHLHLGSIPASPKVRRFKKAVRLLQLIIRACNNNKTSYHQSGEVAESIGLPSTCITAGDSELCFDPNQYKANREGQLNVETKRILTTDVKQRTSEDVHKALVSLRSSLDAFCEFPVKMQESLAKFGWYGKLENRRVIVRQGHRAQYFFLILSGTAVVTTTTLDPTSNEAKVRLVNFLRMGNTFGESELMENVARRHTIVCREEVELMTIDKEDFAKIFTHQSGEENESHLINFLRGIDVFCDWPLDSLPRDNPGVCLLTYFRAGSVICRDSNKSEWLYVIKSGTCRVLKELTEPKNLHKPKESGVSKKPTPPTQLNCAGNKTKLPPIIQVTQPPESNSSHKFYDAAQTVFRTQVLHKKSLSDADDHISLLKSLREITSAKSRSPRMADIARSIIASLHSDDSSEHGKSNKSVFVQLRRCTEREVFGIASILFRKMGGSPSLTLVSEGSECIMISKTFFSNHLTESAKDHLIRSIQPWPSESRLQELLQQYADWQQYKADTMGTLLQQQQRIAEGSM